MSSESLPLNPIESFYIVEINGGDCGNWPNLNTGLFQEDFLRERNIDRCHGLTIVTLVLKPI